MALFDIFKKRKEKERYDKKQQEKIETEQIEKKPRALKKASVSAPGILKSPHIVEKSTLLIEKGVYVFKVSPRANKVMVNRAIKETYGVTPKKINIINIPSKRKFRRGRCGKKSGFKKAVVYLKEGEKIEIS